MYAVLNMGYAPSQWINLNQKDKAFIIAAIKIKMEEQSKANKKLKSKRGRRK